MKFNIKQSKEAAEKQQQENASKVTVKSVESSKTVESKPSVSNTANGKELEFNKQHRESYETLMKESSTQLDGYWDSKNPFVKLLLLGLGAVAVLGVIYYVMTYMATMR